MKKTLVVFLIILFSVSMFSFVKNPPIFDENKLIEIIGTIEKTEIVSERFFLLTFKETNDFKVLFPNYQKLFNLFEKDTYITLNGYFIELKNEKYFIPVKINYKNKTFDLRKNIRKRLYEKRFHMNYYKNLSPKHPHYFNIPHKK
ncbi:hypothetical protein [Marinitoga sp. 38H-ov]|uniref:hypothetical protein n=1 Tax=Marinitoga sp. 38H-ov TaxID=1755814 RepID=UPI0013EBA898|nr:hypothetical protein [Marinitoga sp. 38H-ov]KAF2955061.1 hypothetical protein AS160_02550 [Marinitoga sp. 38H-ov]